MNVKDNQEYLKYPTISKLSLRDKNEYRLSHISVADLLKRIEFLEETSKNQVNLINSQQKKMELLNSTVESDKKIIADLKKKTESYNHRIKVLEDVQKEYSVKAIVPKKETQKELVLEQNVQKLRIKISDTFSFGKYKNKPIEWIVLDEKADGSKLLLSKYALDKKEYNEEFTDATWETCTLRKWLNNDFYNEAFSTEEQSKIQTTILVNEDNEGYGTEGGNDTEDKVFLLSIDEVNRYFKLDEERVCKPTEYAKEQGIYVDEDSGNSYYWLRSPGFSTISAAFVHEDGLVDEYGYRVFFTSGIRPAMWIKI